MKEKIYAIKGKMGYLAGIKFATTTKGPVPRDYEFDFGFITKDKTDKYPLLFIDKEMAGAFAKMAQFFCEDFEVAEVSESDIKILDSRHG